MFCEIDDNAPGFCLVLSEAYWYICFPKIVNGWIQSTIFAKISILGVSLGSECVSSYPVASSIITNPGFHFESFSNFSNLISILHTAFIISLVFYVSRADIFPLGAIMLCLKHVRP